MEVILPGKYIADENKNRDLTSENMEQEDKVNIEETSINLDYVKKELDEEGEFEENQYKIALNFENIFGESSIEHKNNRDNIIGSLDGHTMETATFKLEDFKEKNMDLIQKAIKQFYCNKCGGNYQGYCLNCSSLSHILNNLTPNLNSESVLNTTPINVLEIREVSSRYAVFALKTLPKGIILGPFEGIAPIKSTTVVQWKIKNEKFVNDQNGNWMKYIESVANHASKNLDIFQVDGILYFETSRQIQEGEELLVCYGVEEEVLKSDKEGEFYLVPVKKEEYPKVFACTLCCLGFRLERCLVEHKYKCPQRDLDGKIEDFEIIQCHSCKVLLEKEEHQKSHMLHCLENYNRLRRNMPYFQRKPADEIDETWRNDEISAPIDENSYLPQTEVIHIDKANKKAYFNKRKYKCSECSYQTNRKDSLKQHLNTHNNIKPFECDFCKKKFTQKANLKGHIQNRHSNTTEKKYKCTKCSYQTNYKAHLNRHLGTHDDIKPFECDICKKRFIQKSYLNVHIRYQHSNTSEKEYKCSECSYQTNRKGDLKVHLKKYKNKKHNNIKPFECGICKNRFSNKSSLKSHIIGIHVSENEYKCSQCTYQTNWRDNLKVHLNTHNDIKRFECDICKKGFTQKGSLKLHVIAIHSNTTEREYKCSECSYRTNCKNNLNLHLNTHDNIKPFQCDTCQKRYNRKSSLKSHIIGTHSNTSKNEYKCSNWRDNLKVHLNTHNGIKSFECDICKMRFTKKCNMQFHIRNRHSNTSEKKYECSKCSYRTNRKGDLRKHINTHNDIRPFECDICEKRFTQTSNLNQHIRIQHSNTDEKNTNAPRVLI